MVVRHATVSLTSSQSVDRHRWIGHRIGISVTSQRFWLSTRTILVVWMFLHVHRTESFCFVNKRSLFIFRQQFPFSACEKEKKRKKIKVWKCSWIVFRRASENTVGVDIKQTLIKRKTEVETMERHETQKKNV